jgi:hypothetical protein
MPQNHARIAVLVRTHVANPKFFDLMELLRRSDHYDLFVAADETNGPLQTGAYTKLPHSAVACQALGLPTDHHRILWQCGDYPLYFAAAAIPAYDYYFLIEYDVDFTSKSPDFLEALIARLRNHPCDLLSENFSRPKPDWEWLPAAAKLYHTVYTAGLFAFIAVSRRAIERLLAARRRQNQRGAAGDSIIHCEAFTASELAAAGYACVSINQLIPGATDPLYYHTALYELETSQYLLNHPRIGEAAVQLLHPVYDVAEYLRRQYAKARHRNDIAAFLAELAWIERAEPAARTLAAGYRALANHRV